METILINIPMEMKVKLKKTDNYSKLIRDLLTEHFKKQESYEVLKVKKQELVNDYNMEINEIDNKIKELEELKEREIVEEEDRSKIERIREAYKNGDEELAMKIAKGEK